MAIQPFPPPLRKRRVHKKSRNGCRNCKLRSVKCDEEKPSCKRCVSYRVLCTYAANNDLQLEVEGADRLIFHPGLPYWQCRSGASLFSQVWLVRSSFPLYVAICHQIGGTLRYSHIRISCQICRRNLRLPPQRRTQSARSWFQPFHRHIGTDKGS
jgi:hypothetical protein